MEALDITVVWNWAVPHWYTEIYEHLQVLHEVVAARRDVYFYYEEQKLTIP